MSRKSLFIRGVGIGYIALGANIVYSLASIPIALSYLGKEQFGLWSVVLQIVGYLHLLDFGISNGVSRILVDEKDNRANGAYGSVLLTGSIAQLLIGVAVALGGWCCAPFAAALFDIPETLAGDFSLLIGLQATIAGVGIATRMLGAPLMVYQRQDLIGFQTIGLFAVYFGAMFFGFYIGLGLYAMVLSMASGLFWAVAFKVFYGVRLALLPRRGEWGRPALTQFKKIFAYSRDVFLMGLGWQLLSGSPILVISRTLGLDAAAVWSVCLKPFQILLQLITRPGDLAFPALVEMFVRNERRQLRNRIVQLMQLTAALGAAGCIAAVALNPAFVTIWTGGRVSWPPENHAALGLMVFIYAVMKIPNGFVGISKQIRAMKYLYFLEGLVFVTGSLFLAPKFGAVSVAVYAAVCHLLISTPGGFVYTARDTGAGIGSLLCPLLRPLGFGLIASGIVWGIVVLTNSFDPLLAFLVRLSLLGFLAMGLIAISVEPSLRHEVLDLLSRVLLRHRSPVNIQQ